MDLWHAFILAIVQGLTEFLPISSSAHEILIPHLLGWADQGVAFDAFTGLGTLCAVIVYFFSDLKAIFIHWIKQFCKTPSPDPHGYARLGNLLIVATLPCLLIGFIFRHQIDMYLRSPLIIAITTIVFGIALGLCDFFGKRHYSIDQIGYKQALCIGFAQALALIPGTSRSGVTITTGLLLGLKREAAARFSFLLSIPISLATGLYGLYKLVEDTHNQFDFSVIVCAFVISFISALACIAIFLKFINKFGMMPYMIYRIILGCFLFAFILS